MGQVIIDGGKLYADEIIATSNPPTLNSITNDHINTAAAIARSKLATETKGFEIPFTSLFVHDAPATALPGTSASDDLGFYNGTFGTACPVVRTYDVKNAGSVTLYARAFVRLPAEYKAGQDVIIRASAGMITTVASASASIDVEAYLNGENTLVSGSDLCTTGSQSINSLVFANKDFTIAGATLLAGSLLDVRIAIAVNDSATVTAVIAAIAALKLMAVVQG